MKGLREPRHILLLGNGINRTSGGDDWAGVLKGLGAAKVFGDGGWRNLPFPHVFEALAAAHEYDFTMMKTTIARSIKNVRRNRLHSLLDSLPLQHVLTTNYDYAIEGWQSDLLQDADEKQRGDSENLFRSNKAATAAAPGRRVWHIHGEAQNPPSIVLGFDHYLRCVSAIERYLDAPLPPRSERGQYWGTKKARSPTTFRNSPEDPRCIHPKKLSWVDLFLTSEVHIVGLSMGPEELTLWKALMLRLHWERDNVRYKRQARGPLSKPPPVHFYDLQVDGLTDKNRDGGAAARGLKHRLLQNVGVNVVPLPFDLAEEASGERKPIFADAYRDALNRIGDHIEESQCS